MSVPSDWFERRVESGWELAVAEAAYRFSQVRPSVISSLGSPSPEVRSAAVAALNEANDVSAHDLVVKLANDPDDEVRGEVVEYLAEFCTKSDAAVLLAFIRRNDHVFYATHALERLVEGGPLLYSAEDDFAAAALRWEHLLRDRGLL
jgi:HEAT repeat protein